MKLNDVEFNAAEESLNTELESYGLNEGSIDFYGTIVGVATQLMGYYAYKGLCEELEVNGEVNSEVKDLMEFCGGVKAFLSYCETVGDFGGQFAASHIKK